MTLGGRAGCPRGLGLLLGARHATVWEHPARSPDMGHGLCDLTRVAHTEPRAVTVPARRSGCHAARRGPVSPTQVCSCGQRARRGRAGPRTQSPVCCKHRAASARLRGGVGTAAVGGGAVPCLSSGLGLQLLAEAPAQPPPCAGAQNGDFSASLLDALGYLREHLNVSLFHTKRIVSSYEKGYTEFRNTYSDFKAGFRSYAFISNSLLLTHE